MAKTLIYQLYPLAWRNMKAMTKHLAVIADLGVDYVWLSSIYSSPMFDHGYDVEDYYSIDLRYGSMNDFDEFVVTAHRFGIKVLMDLPLNHTSTSHPWFKNNPDYYCFSNVDNQKWKNLFDEGSSWEFDFSTRKYYLHLFHRRQADLNWFLGADPNWRLIREFQSIVRFWTFKHEVDGFRLDVPQALNKNLGKIEFEFSDLLYGDRAIQIINYIFPPSESSAFLISECFDPSFGDLINLYASRTNISFVSNVMLKESIFDGVRNFENNFARSVASPNFLLDLESHDSPRFTSASSMHAEEIIWTMFNSRAEAICLYQGQELGLKNPPKYELTDQDMIRLDAKTAMQFHQGKSLDDLRPTSRANARVCLPMQEYERQINNPNSYFNLTKRWITRWKQL